LNYGGNGASLFAQHSYRIFKALEGKRKHAVADQLLDAAVALVVFPYKLLRWVD
jgi:hypothetical protein